MRLWYFRFDTEAAKGHPLLADPCAPVQSAACLKMNVLPPVISPVVATC
jgi:hypothetical protein